MTTQRASCWSITINNPTEAETQVQLHPGWKLCGQLEKGNEGTEHFQGMLRTPQVRFSAVKALFPRAHIEVARNPKALETYVQKEDTRLAEWTQKNQIPTIFEFQHHVARMWHPEEWARRQAEDIDVAQHYNQLPKDVDALALDYVDDLVRICIANGLQGAEWIAINPMWRSSWKKFWRSIIERNASQTLHQAPPPPQEASTQDQSTSWPGGE